MKLSVTFNGRLVVLSVTVLMSVYSAMSAAAEDNIDPFNFYCFSLPEWKQEDAIEMDSLVPSERERKERNTPVGYSAPDNSRYAERNIAAYGVRMGGGISIQMTPDEKDQNKRSIFSFGFGGCTGTVLYVLLKSGKQRAALAHYDPMSTEWHLSKIHDLCAKLKQDASLDEITKVVAIIFHPEDDWKKSVPSDYQLVKRLRAAINAEFDGDIKIIQELYAVRSLYGGDHSKGMFENRMVPKDLEIVLSANPEESYFQSKATNHTKQHISAL